MATKLISALSMSATNVVRTDETAKKLTVLRMAATNQFPWTVLCTATKNNFRAVNECTKIPVRAVH